MWYGRGFIDPRLAIVETHAISIEREETLRRPYQRKNTGNVSVIDGKRGNLPSEGVRGENLVTGRRHRREIVTGGKVGKILIMS